MGETLKTVEVTPKQLEDGWEAPEGWSIAGVDRDKGGHAVVYLVSAARTTVRHG